MGGVLSIILGHVKVKPGVKSSEQWECGLKGDCRNTASWSLSSLWSWCEQSFFYHNRPEVLTYEEPNHVFDSQS